MIHVVITSANVPAMYEKRKALYIESIEACLQYRDLFDSYTVLECVSAHEAYLEPYTTYYSTIGNPYANKGLNEMRHLAQYLSANNSLHTGDAIIKLTGRYIVEEPYFFEQVRALHEEYESIFKNDDDFYVGNGYHTFFYYMRKGLLLEAVQSLEFSDANDRPIEWDVKSFVMPRETNLEIDRLGLLAYQGADSSIIFRC